MSHLREMKTVRRIAGLVCGGVVCAASVGSDFEPPLGSDPVSDRGILELVAGVDIQGVLDRYGFTLIDAIPGQGIYMVSFQPQLTEDQFELLFLTDAEIDHSELNFGIGDSGPGTQSTFLGTAPSTFAGQPVWADLGLDVAHASATGVGVTIAVLDTGIDTDNPMFVGRLSAAAISYVGGPNDIEDDGNGINDDGEGFVDEMVGHGTWVAGLAAMVAPGAEILPIRVMDDEGFADAFTVAKAIYYAVDQGAGVINLSLGSVADVRIVERAVKYAGDFGVIVVASAGNQGVGRPEFPAGLNDAFGVAAIELSGVAASFTNYGRGVLLSAPGVDIVGPIPSGFGVSDGTSAAAPLVSGAAALLIEQGKVRRADDFETFAKQATRRISQLNPGLDGDALGEGALDLEMAVAWAGPCFADLTDDGMVTFADVTRFIDLFIGNTVDGLPDEDVDFVAPRGAWTFADIVFFLDAFAAGCP